MRRPLPGVVAFSLVEVVLAMAVASVSILSILALFSVVVQTTKQVTDQDEAVGVVNALPSFFRSVGFGAMYTNIQSPGSLPPVFAYCSTNYSTTNSGPTAITVIDTNNATLMTPTYSASRSGRLFQIVLIASTNVPVCFTTNATPTYITNPAMLPSSVASYGDSILPVNVRIYTAPAATSSTNTPAGSPVFTYDTVLSR